jgi:hypothetical protein
MCEVLFEVHMLDSLFSIQKTLLQAYEVIGIAFRLLNIVVACVGGGGDNAEGRDKEQDCGS